MWTCPTCNRIFEKALQPHSCRQVSLEEHFKNKQKAKELFDFLFKIINKKIDKCKIISFPCCVHLFSNYDFLAALPKKDRLEIRFGLNKKLENPRVKQYVPISKNAYKNCLDITETKEIDNELLEWLVEAYHLKDKTS